MFLTQESPTSSLNGRGESMPDVAANLNPLVGGTLDRVGMQQVELPVLVDAGDGSNVRVPAVADLYVNLADSRSKGIHMSRLYKAATEELSSQPLNLKLLKGLLDRNLESHSDISTESALELRFELMTQRPSLLSGLKGWRSYPIRFGAHKSIEGTRLSAEVEITYSSTCPCSASLARQLIQKRFLECFEGQDQVDTETMVHWLGREDSILATPHSQRSTAIIRVELKDDTFDPIQLIDAAEKAISTPVQAMVKREDEQEFALLNGRNLMFCEDAARRLKSLLSKAEYKDFRCEVKHMESLHPHDAVAIFTKGIPGGFQP